MLEASGALVAAKALVLVPLSVIDSMSPEHFLVPCPEGQGMGYQHDGYINAVLIQYA